MSKQQSQLAQANRLRLAWADQRLANPCASLAVLAGAVAYTARVPVVASVVAGAAVEAAKGYTQPRMPWR
jgi:hypothetical protein